MEPLVLLFGAFGAILGFVAVVWLGTRQRAPDRRIGNPKPWIIRPSDLGQNHGAMFRWVLERDDWVVLDLETNGFSDRCEVIEIAIIDAHGRTLMDQLILPKGRIPKAATKVHGIDRSMLKGMPTWPEVADRVSALLRGRPVITYNAEYDLRLLEQTFAKWKLVGPEIDGHCAMVAYANHRGVEHPRFPGEYRWHKLVAACRHERISSAQDHRALGDAHLARSLVLGVARKQSRLAA